MSPVVAKHGTRSRYTAGCRCVPCAAAQRAYRRQLYRRQFRTVATRGRHLDPHGRLEVECWCRTAIVLVPQNEVMACRTLSCGRPGCEEAA